MYVVCLRASITRSAKSLTLFRQNFSVRFRSRPARVAYLIYLFLGAYSLPGFAGGSPSLIHGLWVWKSPTVLEAALIHLSRQSWE